MVPHTPHVLFADQQCDRYLTEAVAHLSSSPPARRAARAWLAAYDAAQRSRAPADQGLSEADAAFRRVLDSPARQVSAWRLERMSAA